MLLLSAPTFVSYFPALGFESMLVSTIKSFQSFSSFDLVNMTGLKFTILAEYFCQRRSQRGSSHTSGFTEKVIQSLLFDPNKSPDLFYFHVRVRTKQVETHV